MLHEDSADKLSQVGTIDTEYGAKTMAMDPKTHNLFLSTSDFGLAAGPKGRRPAISGTAHLLIYGPLEKHDSIYGVVQESPWTSKGRWLILTKATTITRQGSRSRLRRGSSSPGAALVVHSGWTGVNDILSGPQKFRRIPKADSPR
jgi:hypothetical protein